MTAPPSDRARLQRLALRLEYGTIAWNVGEAVLTLALGAMASSLALIGFGAVSVVEVFASLVVVWHLVPEHETDHPRRTRLALRLVGLAFGVLAIALALVAISDLTSERRAEESPWGIGYLILAAVVMFGLARVKRKTAEQLDSEPLRAEATMTLLDGFLATATLVGLALNAAAGWWWADPAAALIVAVAAANEARENWEAGAEIE
jgi:divalent metal cation (Fe/Co/Zn/Cd) transporter